VVSQLTLNFDNSTRNRECTGV